MIGRLIGVLLFAVFGLAQSARGNEVFLEIRRSGFEKIPITLLEFENRLPSSEALRRIDLVLRQDLMISQLFELRSADGLGRMGEASNPLLFEKAALSGIQGMVWARLDRRGEEMVLEARVFETGKGQQVIATKILGGPQNLRAMAHRLANKIVQAFTGEPGIAESRIAYISDITGSKEIYLMDYDGAGERRLTSDQSIIISPRWSPNGQQLVYTSFREGNPDIYLLLLQSGESRKIIDFSGLNISGRFSPKGDLIAFATNRDGNEEIYTSDVSGGNLRRLTFNPSDDLSPSWSPTGTHMAFTSDRGGTPQIYVMDANGSNLRRLTFTGNYNTSPNWSPKGDWVAYVCMNEERRLRICLITPNGEIGRQLTGEGDWDDEDPSWSPDGRGIVFSSNRDGKKNIYTLFLDGTGLKRLTFNGGNNLGPAWSPG